MARKPMKKAAPKKTAAKAKKSMAKASKGAAKKAAPAKAAAPAKPAAPAKMPKSRKASKPKNGSTMSYTQSEFIDNLKEFCGLPKRSEAKEIWEDISAFLTDSLKKGYKVPLVGLGKMYVRKSKARMGRNPATGELIQIAAKKRVRFTPAKALKDTVL